jgi:hypothetical protein
MKIHMAKLSILTLCAAAILAVPALSRAQDNTANAPAAAEKSKPAKKHSGVLPFHGKLVSVDSDAMTLTVGKRTFQITSETKITKDGKPAVLADGVAGEPVSGSYKKAEDGTLTAATVHFGAKAKAGDKKKKEAAGAGN